MKRILLIATMLLAFGVVNAQSSFSDMTDVIKFMENKTYYNSETDVELEYGYISSYNTYGIKLKSNKSGRTMYFINCDIETYGSFADVSGTSTSDGSNFKFRLYKNRIIIGIGEQRQTTFYLKASSYTEKEPIQSNNQVPQTSAKKINKPNYFIIKGETKIPNSFVGKFIQGSNYVVITKTSDKSGNISVSYNGKKYTVPFNPNNYMNSNNIEFYNSVVTFGVFGIDNASSIIKEIDLRINYSGDNWNTDSNEDAKKIRFIRQ
jgi:hypothetical protein